MHGIITVLEHIKIPNKSLHRNFATLRFAKSRELNRYVFQKTVSHTNNCNYFTVAIGK
jgi:hypothetical protein